jgi:glycosyltransferase involved in cell wall biosynthesis
MPDMPPAVSVLVCTRNRPQDIVWALPSILGNTHPNYEVIVVDQSDGCETTAIVEPYKETHPHLRYIHSTTRGLSPARNLAMSMARAEIIAFTDDDCETGCDWVTQIADYFAREADADLLFGQVLMPADAEKEGLSVPCLYFETSRRLRVGEIFGMGANMAFRRSLLKKIGGYDNILGPGAPLACAYDYDFSYRAQRAGASVVAEPTITLVHRATRTREQWNKVSYLYGIGDAAFYTKHARCGDLWAARMLSYKLAQAAARTVVKSVRKQPNNSQYLHGFCKGIWESYRYPIDRAMRLYRTPAARDRVVSI